MSRPISRSEFLRGGPDPRTAPLRPPWALREAAFVAACTRCDECVVACQQGVLRVGSRGFPEVSFTDAGCTFCQDCVDACPAGALSAAGAARPWAATAVIDGSCLASAGVVCRVCGEHCEAGAITFRLAPGGVTDAMVDSAACNGCGDCVAPCPATAIAVVAQAPGSDGRGVAA